MQAVRDFMLKKLHDVKRRDCDDRVFSFLFSSYSLLSRDEFQRTLLHRVSEKKTSVLLVFV